MHIPSYMTPYTGHTPRDPPMKRGPRELGLIPGRFGEKLGLSERSGENHSSDVTAVVKRVVQAGLRVSVLKNEDVEDPIVSNWDRLEGSSAAIAADVVRHT